MKLKCAFEIIDMGSELIAVPVGEKAGSIHGVVKLNAGGKEIFELLRSETSQEAIVESLLQKYENDRATLESYVHSVIDTLQDANVLQ